MRKLGFTLMLCGCLLALCGRANAVIGTIDAVPATTLLIPYFEVDVENADGINTLFSVNNASASAVLAHVVVWTDQSVAALDFDIYLTGYDVQTISLRDIFVNGNIPITASAGQDPKDTVSPKGPVSQDINFATCGSFPYPPAWVSPTFRAHLKAWLSGGQSPASGNCAGSKRGDGRLRGYITIDTVSACNVFFPADWAFYVPFVTNQNVLWGDIFYVNPSQDFAQGVTAVHVEACPTCFVPGDHTFYGRYNGNTATDFREPLPTTMAARFVNGGLFQGGTDFLIWREANSSAAAYSCALQGPSSWYPLESTEIVIFDEQEQPVVAEGCPSGDPTCTQVLTIPNEVNRIDVAEDLLAPFDFGWVYLNLQHPDTAYADPYAQMWLITTMEADGRFSVGYDGIQLDTANDPVLGRVIGDPEPGFQAPDL